MSIAPEPGRLTRWRARPDRVLLVGACAVAVLTGWFAVAFAMFFLAMVWLAIQEWPTGSDARSQRLRAAVTLVLLAAVAVSLSLEWWTPAAALAITAALAAPRRWIHLMASSERDASAETDGG